MERNKWIPFEAEDMSREQAEERDTLRARIEHYTKQENWRHFTPEFVDTHTQSVNISALDKEVRMATNRFKEARLGQEEGNIKMETDLPFTIFFVGDVHYGSIFTDNNRFTREMEQIKNTPNAYIVLMSNLIDNAIPAQYPDSMLNNAIPPDKQVIYMREKVKELDEAGKVLGAVESPCHEGWTWKKTGQNVNALIFGFEDRRFPILENGGRLNLRCQGRLGYVLGIYHKIGPFRSNFNRTHGLKQMNRLKQNMECDVVAGAHYHVGAVEETYEGVGERHRVQKVYVQSGTYKGTGEVHDGWAIGRYGDTGQPTGQSVTFWPKEKRMSAHLDFETGMLAHEAHYLREGVRQSES